MTSKPTSPEEPCPVNQQGHSRARPVHQGAETPLSDLHNAVLCSLKASILLTCAHRLAVHHKQSAVWFITRAGACLDLPGLLLPPGTSPTDAAFNRVKIHTLSTHEELIKLLASVHLLPSEEIPCALLLDDSRLYLLGTPYGTAGRVSEQRLAFGAVWLFLHLVSGMLCCSRKAGFVQ
jgi:hypothetical protein